jgi:hypothetical protein
LFLKICGENFTVILEYFCLLKKKSFWDIFYIKKYLKNIFMQTVFFFNFRSKISLKISHFVSIQRSKNINSPFAVFWKKIVTHFADTLKNWWHDKTKHSGNVRVRVGKHPHLYSSTKWVKRVESWRPEGDGVWLCKL